MTELDAALMDATSALLAMRMGLRDEDMDLIMAAAVNLKNAAAKAHFIAYHLARAKP